MTDIEQIAVISGILSLLNLVILLKLFSAMSRRITKLEQKLEQV